MNRFPAAVACLALACVVARSCAAAVPGVTLQTVVALKADQRTILVRGGDRVIAHQPDVSAGRNLVVIGGPDGVRSLRIGLGAAGVDENGRETFEVKAVAPLPNGEVLMYVAAIGRADVGGLWRWRPGSEPARRVVTGREIADASGFGTLLALAEVQLAAAGGDIWVVLRAPDQTAFCRIDARRIDNSARVAWAFSKLTTTIDDGDVALPVERQDQWTGRADGSLVLFRPSRGEAWRVDLAGRATRLHAPAADAPIMPQDARPMSTVPPLELPTPARPAASTWAGPGVLHFHPSPSHLSPLPGEGVPRHPVLVLNDGKTETLITRDNIAVRPGFPVHALRLSAWCVDASGTIVAYDAMSGEVFRLNPAK